MINKILMFFVNLMQKYLPDPFTIAWLITLTVIGMALGMTNTKYANPEGLTAPGHLTSARDLSILAQRLMKLRAAHRLIDQLFPAAAVHQHAVLKRQRDVKTF